MHTSSAVKRGLLVLGSFAIAYNLSVLLHELCHSMAAFLTGGTCSGIYINPFSWSFSSSSSPNPLLHTIAGPFGSALIGLILFFLIWRWYRPVLVPLLLIGPVMLIFNGGYLLVDTLMRSGGDGCSMIRKGVSPMLVIIAAMVLLLGGLGLSVLFVRKTRLLSANFKGRLITISLGIVPYLAVVAAWNYFYNRSEIMLWLTYAVLGTVSSIALAAIPLCLLKIQSDQLQPFRWRGVITVNLFAVGLVVFFLLTGPSDLKAEAGISKFSYPSPDGDILAVLVGTKLKDYDRSAFSETKPVLLKLNEKSLLESYQQVEDWVFRDMAWNPAYVNQLYYVTFEKLYESGGGSFYELSSGKFYEFGIGKLLMLDANSGDNSITTINQSSYPNISSCFRWSPDGKTLAGLALKPESRMLNSGELAVSYDGGKTCELTGINMHGHPVWLNNKELFIRTDHDHTVVKVLCDGQDFKITETFAINDCQITFKGSFQGNPVYTAYPRKDDEGKYIDKLRRLFVGDKLICEADNPYFKVITFSDNIVVEADRKVLIFDENLSLCHEMRLGRKTHMLNFQPKTNTVFLVKAWKSILCYDYTKDEKPHILFSVDMLDESSN